MTNKPITDTDRIEWLALDNDRLEDVRGYMNNEDVPIRVAIDYLTKAHAREAQERRRKDNA